MEGAPDATPLPAVSAVQASDLYLGISVCSGETRLGRCWTLPGAFDLVLPLVLGAVGRVDTLFWRGVFNAGGVFGLGDVGDEAMT